MTDEFPRLGSTGTAAARQARAEGGVADAAWKTALLESLVAGMARGEQDALAGLYDETAGLLNGLMLRMLESAAEAEEALLDLYMKAWRDAGSFVGNRASLSGSSSVQGWLVVIGRAVAIERRRARGDVSARDTAGEGDQGRIHAVIGELPAEQREVLDLVFYGGFTHAELAAHLQVPLSTIKNRIGMALSRVEGKMAS